MVTAVVPTLATATPAGAVGQPARLLQGGAPAARASARAADYGVASPVTSKISRAAEEMWTGSAPGSNRDMP